MVNVSGIVFDNIAGQNVALAKRDVAYANSSINLTATEAMALRELWNHFSTRFRYCDHPRNGRQLERADRSDGDSSKCSTVASACGNPRARTPRIQDFAH